MTKNCHFEVQAQQQQQLQAKEPGEAPGHSRRSIISPNKSNSFRTLFVRVSTVSAKREKELEAAKALRQEILSTYRTIMDAIPSNSNYLRPCIPLEDTEVIDVDRTQLLTYTLKIRPGGGNDHTYKKVVRLFSEGTVPDWIETIKDIKEIWVQNSVNGPHDRAAVIRTILKDEALSHFDNAVEDLQTNEYLEPQEFTAETVDKALEAVSQAVFPHRALETQKLWMRRHLKKPSKMRYRLFHAKVLKMNKSLPFFPGATEESKFGEKDILEILEFSLPRAWRAKFDLNNYVPTKHNLTRLLQEVEAIERNQNEEPPKKKRKVTRRATTASLSDKIPKKKSSNNNKEKFCKEHGHGNHTSAECWSLHPELIPKKFAKSPEKEKTKKVSKKVTKESLYTTLARSAKPLKKTKKSVKTVATDTSDSEESIHQLEVEEDRKETKEEKAQRYRAKMAEAAANDSDSD